MSGDRSPGSTLPERGRAQWVADTLVELASTVVSDFDLFDLLTVLTARSADLLQTGEVCLLLAGDDTKLRVVASSSEEMHRLELFEVLHDEGPCFDVYRSGIAILNEPLGHDSRWPRFARLARAQGFHTAHALPMRHEHEVIGVLNILDHREATLSEAEIAATQALADITSFAILQHRALRHATEMVDQLRKALQTRIVVEQAKGVIAAHLDVDVARAFFLLREYSRNRNERLADASRRIIARSLSAEEVVSGAHGYRRKNRTVAPPRDPDA